MTGIMAVAIAVQSEPVSLLMKVSSENAMPSFLSPVFHSM